MNEEGEGQCWIVTVTQPQGSVGCGDHTSRARDPSPGAAATLLQPPGATWEQTLELAGALQKKVKMQLFHEKSPHSKMLAKLKIH